MLLQKQLVEVSAVLASVLCGLGVVTAGLGQSSPESSKSGILVSCDIDCVVAIDDKFVGRVQGGKQLSLSVSDGKHKVAAATQGGDYLEQTLDSGSASRSAQFAFKDHSHGRASLERNVASLQQQVKAKEDELARIGQPPSTIELTPEMDAKERSLIVEAVNYYTDRYGTELGMRDSRNSSSQQLNDDATLRDFQNIGNSDTVSSATNLGIVLAESIAAHRIAVKAHRDALAAEAASFRMQYLGRMLENPASRPKDELGSSYLVMVRDVTRKKTPGRLLTAPDRIEYSDRAENIRLSCTDLKKAQGDKHLSLTWIVTGPLPKAKKSKRTLELTAVQKNERSLLAGDIYLACPRFTQ